MLNNVMIINAILASAAVVYGLCCRSFGAALIAGLLIALVHAGLVVLLGLQAGSLSLTELPYLKDGVDAAMQTGHLTFAHARYVAYLVGAGLVLLLITMAGWLVRLLFTAMGFASRRQIQA